MEMFLTGSRDLTEIDRSEIIDYLNRYGPNHTIHILCDKSIENEVLKYYIENDLNAHKLHIYTFQPYRNLPSFLKEPIDFLKSKGSKYHSFDIEDIQIKREEYTESLNEIVPYVDLVVCFYNGDSSKRLIPVDVAKENKIDAMLYDLPGYDITKKEMPLEHKIRVV